MALAGAGNVADKNDNDLCYIRKVPNEIILETLTYLKLEDILNFKATCGPFRDVVEYNENMLARHSLFDHCHESMIPLAIALQAAAVAPWKPSKLNPGLGADLGMLHEYCEQYLGSSFEEGPALANLDLRSVVGMIAFYDASLTIARYDCLLSFMPTTGDHPSNKQLKDSQMAVYRMGIIGHLLHLTPIDPEAGDPAWDMFSRYISLKAKKELECMRVVLCDLFISALQPKYMNDSDLKAALKCMMACGIERLIMARDCQHGPPEDGRQQLADIIQANGCFRTTLWGIDGVEDRMDKTWTCMIIAPQEEIEEKERQIALALRLLATRNQEELWWLTQLVKPAQPVSSAAEPQQAQEG